MPVPAYIEIPDADIDPESPINYSLLARLRDNILAVIGGGVDAPTMEPSLLGISGSRADGILDDSWAPTTPGYYDFDGDEPSILSSPRSMPWFTCIRHRGDLEISATQTLDKIDRTEIPAAQAFGLAIGEQGGFDDSAAGVGGQIYGGGGGNGGNGGDSSNGDGGNGRDYANMLRWWLTKCFPAGGFGGDTTAGIVGGDAGGVFVLLVEGDLTMTGGTISAIGGNASGGGGGGSGGTIIILCTGTITDGTFVVSGGTAGATNGGGGGGGAVALVANAFAGTQTFTKGGGNGGHGGGHPSGSTGAAGYSGSITVPAETLRGLLWR